MPPKTTTTMTTKNLYEGEQTQMRGLGLAA
jgi:hypothetical protein